MKRQTQRFSHRLIKEVNRLDLSNLEKYLLHTICQYKQVRLHRKFPIEGSQLKEGLATLIQKKYIIYMYKVPNEKVYYFDVNGFKIEDDAYEI